MIDAVARLAGCPFNQALREGLYGFNPRRLVGEASGWTADRLPEPSRTIDVRHTVGMLDPLSVAEIPADQRIDDGLPQSLEEDIDAYGLRWFKVKVCGDPVQDAARLWTAAQGGHGHVERDSACAGLHFGPQARMLPR